MFYSLIFILFLGTQPSNNVPLFIDRLDHETPELLAWLGVQCYVEDLVHVDGFGGDGQSVGGEVGRLWKRITA